MKGIKRVAGDGKPGEMWLKEVARGTLRDLVVRELRDAIATGRIVAGDRLVETDLARQLGVSRAPVREAVSLLEQEGLISRVAHRGSFLAVLDADEIREVFLLRALLEGLAAKLFIERSGDASLEALRKRCVQMQKASDDDDPMTFAAADREFHRLLVLGAHSKRLQLMWETMYAQIGLIARAAISEPEADLSFIAHSHKQVLEALERRDLAAARAYCETHIQSGGERVVRRLKAVGPESSSTAVVTDETCAPKQQGPW
jgi:DNA-binding GntR family transcriptional regulator